MQLKGSIDAKFPSLGRIVTEPFVREMMEFLISIRTPDTISTSTVGFALNCFWQIALLTGERIGKGQRYQTQMKGVAIEQGTQSVALF
jgi:hypothetical protein